MHITLVSPLVIPTSHTKRFEYIFDYSNNCLEAFFLMALCSTTRNPLVIQMYADLSQSHDI